jgi:hypothetical protein
MRRGRGPVVVNRRGPGLMGTMARTAVIAGTATVAVKATSSMMGGGSKKQAEAAQDQDIAQLQAQQDSSLKDQGLLTDEEFAAKKAQILGI